MNRGRVENQKNTSKIMITCIEFNLYFKLGYRQAHNRWAPATYGYSRGIERPVPTVSRTMPTGSPASYRCQSPSSSRSLHSSCLLNFCCLTFRWVLLLIESSYESHLNVQGTQIGFLTHPNKLAILISIQPSLVRRSAPETCVFIGLVNYELINKHRYIFIL